jgi:S-adenosylmethionine-dependent methyltransferase
VSFDGIADAFETEIYGSTKGDIRLNVLWEDMVTNMPRLADGGLRILDAGGGAGHVTMRLAALGNHVVLADPSREMLDHAQTAIDDGDLGSWVSVVHAPIQRLGSLLDQQFDVIVCHAVLEWLADPQSALDELVSLLELDGELSLLFYNRNARLLKLILSGAFEEALRECDSEPSPRGSERGAIPLAEATVRAWLAELGLGVRSKAAIRIFHDHLTDGALSSERLGELLSVEKALRDKEPFASLGQHIHLVCAAAPDAARGRREG